MSRPKVNTNFFNSRSPAMVYILGFIFADGCLVEHKNGYHGLDITSKDIEHLRLIKKQLKAEHKIGKKERGYHIQIRNRNIYNDLIRLGLTPRKSKRVRFPKIPKRYSSHFIRGLFDGDGSVVIWPEPRWNHTWQIKVVFTSGSLRFLQELRKYLQSTAGLLRGRIAPTTRADQLIYSTKGECIALYRFMYKGNTRLYLKRKKEKFEKFLSLKSDEVRIRPNKEFWQVSVVAT